MAGSNHSFQEVLKLMSSMTTFETLLDAADLNLETCVKLGIQGQFKNLHEKIGKYVQYDETNDLNIKCTCSLCFEELRIFNSDLKSSWEIHSRSELHKIIVKNKEMNQNSKNIPPDFKKAQFQPQMKNNLLENEKVKDVGKKKNNLSGSKIQLPCRCQTAFCTCGYKTTGLPRLGETLSNLNLSQVDLQHLLPMQLIQGASGLQLNTSAPQNMKLAKANNSSSQNKSHMKRQDNKKEAPKLAIPTSQQSINIHLHMPSSQSQAPVAQRSTSKPRHQSPNTTLITTGNLDKLRLRELSGRPEIQLMFQLVKEAEGALWKRENITKDGDEFDCNICGNHMTSPYDLVMHTKGRAHQENLKESHTKPQHHHGNLLTETNMEKLRSRNLDEGAELSLMWKMVKQAEGKNWERNNITKITCEEFTCNICNMDLNSPHQLMQHVQGKGHQSNLGTR